jgi:hypothetical protein
MDYALLLRTSKPFTGVVVVVLFFVILALNAAIIIGAQKRKR